MTFDQLLGILEAAGAVHRVVRRGRGAYVVIPQGGRVLGAWPDADADNLFWTADCCKTADSLRTAIELGEWNLGGDRLWFGPELNLFVKNPEATGPEFVPSAIDPGAYDVHVEDDIVVMRQSGTLSDARNGVEIHFESERTVRPIETPVADVDGADYVGYEFASAIRGRTDGGPAPCVNLWQLAQVPPRGEILVPTWDRALPYDFFSTGVADWCRIEPAYVAFPITGEERHKLGLESWAVCGRIGYLRRLSDDTWSLIVRSFQPVPGGHYPDFPIADLSLCCFAVQCYNDGGLYGGFGEAEHHAPVVTAGNACHSRDVAQLWAFAGPPKVIRQIVGSLLGKNVAAELHLG